VQKPTSHRAQARSALKPLLALGTPRHQHRGDGLIHSIGTYRVYLTALTLLSRWLRGEYRMALKEADESACLVYLGHRAACVGQQTLDCDRKAIQAYLGMSLPRLRAKSPHDELAQRPRAYTWEQKELIKQFVSPRRALAIQIAWEAGLRAMELYSLRPRRERAPSQRRWDAFRFYPLSMSEHRLYTVQGKGGLVREVILSAPTATCLEAKRTATLALVRDRDINFLSAYDLPGGLRISSAWTQASTRLFGWSNGFHGLRHSYCQRRLHELIAAGISFQRGRQIVSQELGHFNPETTNHYLR